MAKNRRREKLVRTLNWSWLRRQLRAKDLADLHAKRPPIKRAALKLRVRALCRSRKGKQVAASCARGLRRVCEEVIRKRGKATRG
jgi:hypothetical protein